MLSKFPLLQRFATQAGAGVTVLCLICPATGQTLPVAGDPQAAAARDRAERQATQDRDDQRREGIRGVREQDNAARRTANQLNRDARQEARAQATAPSTQQAQGAGNFATTTTGQTNLQTSAALNANLRGADLGVWLTNIRGDAGLLVTNLADQSVFAQAGLQEGDRILTINGQPVASEAQFVQMLLAPGQLNQNQTVSLIVFRNGQQQTITLQPALIAQSVIPADPFYQAGLIVDQSDPNQIVVQQVFPRTPAFYAGLRPGDIITNLNGQPITSIAELSRALTMGGGNDLALAITRSGQNRLLTLNTLGDRSIRTAQRTDSAPLGTTTFGAPAGTRRTGIGAAGTGVGGAPIGTTNPAAAAQFPPSRVTTPTSPSLLRQGAGVRTAVPGVSTAVPGLSPSGTGLAPADAGLSPAAGPTGAAGLTPSASAQGGNISPANPALPTFGSPTATGATGTTGGTGATAGGVGATGGTGAVPGGTGSTAGPSGGAGGGLGTGTSGAGGTGSGAGGAGAGAGGAGASGT